MISPSHVQAMASYNRWMNERLYEMCHRLPDEVRKHDSGCFFKSIHGTLNHILLADRLWMGRFTATPFSCTALDEELHVDFADLRAAREEEDERINAWSRSLSDLDLGTELAYTSAVNPRPRRYPLWFAVTHFFNHQTHHRGQITTLLSQNGMDPGVTDLIWLPEFQTPAS